MVKTAKKYVQVVVCATHRVEYGGMCNFFAAGLLP
jgi:hypothetical protein